MGTPMEAAYTFYRQWKASRQAPTSVTFIQRGR